MALLYNGDDLIAQLNIINEEASGDCNVVNIQIDDNISTKEKFIDYLNNTDINISDYLGQIIIFESNDDGDLFDFVVVPTNYDNEGILMCSDSSKIYKICKDIYGYFTDYINDSIMGDLDNLQTNNKNNLVGAINEVNTKANNNAKDINRLDLSLIDLKEALYGYVLDTSDVEIESTIPSTTNGYNLVDNVRGLVKEIKGNTIKCNNLINITDVSSTTINGITYSINNGVIILNGTSTAQCIIKQTNLVLSAGTYTVSATNGVSGAYFQFIENNNFHNCYGSKTFTFTLTQETTCIYRYIIDSGIPLTNQKISAMLNVGSTALPFEPYFDGLKNVDYQGLKISGKNLFDKDNAINGYYVKYDNGELITASNFCYEYINVKSNTTYSVSATRKQTGLQVAFFDKDKNYLSGLVLYSMSGTDLRTFTTPNNCSIISLGLPLVEKETFILNIGSSSLEYAPYKAPQTILNTLGTITLNGVGNVKDKIVITKNTDNEYYTATKVINCKIENNEVVALDTPTETILSNTLTENDVMPLLELNGSVDIINSNNVNGSTTIEMVYKLINTSTTSEVQSNE